MWKYIITGGIVLVLIASGTLWYVFRPVYEPEIALAYIDSIALYEELSETQFEYTSRPGEGSNPHRQELHIKLSSILTEEMSDEDRLVLAQDALVHTDAIRAEIDLAAASREKVESAIDDVVRQQNELTSRKLQEISSRILNIMRVKQEIIANSIATMYAINGQTEGIITTIIENNGTLSPGHIHQINQETDDAEARFDRLTELYKQLAKNDSDLHIAYEEFANVGL